MAVPQHSAVLPAAGRSVPGTPLPGQPGQALHNAVRVAIGISLAELSGGGVAGADAAAGFLSTAVRRRRGGAPGPGQVRSAGPPAVSQPL